MKTYDVAISGYVVVTVRANNKEEAKEAALETEIGGEVYNYEIDDVQEVNR